MEEATLTAPDLMNVLAPDEEAEVQTASQPYVGQWNRLISTTNWEKGRIILEWRHSLIETGSPASWYSDEAWAQLVGGVTGQHAGRLRRVFQRFGDSYTKYEGLFWSHFQAALDWEDAEMWLEGAARTHWTVAEMRATRWETLGQVERRKSKDEPTVASETDEDFVPTVVEDNRLQKVEQSTSDQPAAKAKSSESKKASAESAAISGASAPDAVDFVRPFENLSELPEDLAEAFEAYKLAILRHKGEGWTQISCQDVLASLDALKELAKAPSSETP